VTPIEQQREWLALLEAELARRTVRAAWEAGQNERLRQQLFDTLQEMAQRFAGPMRAPRCLGSAAIVIRVSAAVLSNRS
jgi:hypothetical protein